MTIDLVPVDQSEEPKTEQEDPQEQAPEEPKEEEAREEPEPEQTPPPKRRGRPAGSKNKPKAPQVEEEEVEEPPPRPKRIAQVETQPKVPQPRVSPTIPFDQILRQRMIDIQAHAIEERAARQNQYTQMLQQKMRF